MDTPAPLPYAFLPSETTSLTGSSDGLLHAVTLFPTKLLGVVADHGDLPIERIAADRGGEGRWVGSAGHEEVLKLTDLQEVFGDDDDEEDGEEREGETVEKDSDVEDEEHRSSEDEGPGLAAAPPRKAPEPEEEEQPEAGQEAEGADADSSGDEGAVERKRKRKKDKDPLKATKRKRGRNEGVAEPSFFADP